MRNEALAIWTYENSIERPARERVTDTGPTRRPRVANPERAPCPIHEYAERCVGFLRFGYEVDEATSGAYEPFDMLKIRDTPACMLEAGFAQRPMLYTQAHLADALRPKQRHRSRYHGLTIPLVKRLPELFETPVLMCDNPSREDAIVLVLPAADPDGLPLIASVKPDGLGSYEAETDLVNMVLTVFGKQNFNKYFETVLTPDTAFYFDPRKGQELERLCEGFSNAIYSGLDPKTILRTPECLAQRQPEARPRPTESRGVADLASIATRTSSALTGLRGGSRARTSHEDGRGADGGDDSRPAGV